MSKSSTIVPHLLDEDNYEDWSVYIKNYLRSQDLWRNVEHGDATEWLSSGGELVDWEKKNFAALHVIQISCSQKIFAQIKEIESPKDAWEKLAKMHQEILRSKASSSSQGNAGQASSSSSSQANAEDELVDSVNVVKSINKGDWNTVRQFADKYPKTTLVNGHQTALQVAIVVGQERIAKQLIDMMSDEELEIKSSMGETALSFAAYQGRTSIVKCLVQRNNRLLSIPDNGDTLPIFYACNTGRVEITRYLYDVTPNELFLQENGKYGVILMFLSIINNMLGITLDPIRRNPSLAVTKDQNFPSPIFKLSEQSFAFYSGSNISFWQRWIYYWIKVQLPIQVQPPVGVTATSNQSHNKNNIGRILVSGLLCGMGSLVLKLPGIQELYDLKSKHQYAVEVLRCICEHVSTFRIEERAVYGVDAAAIEAAKRGTFEFFIEIWKANPSIVHFYYDRDGRHAMMVAIQYRQTNVFNLFHGLDDSRKAEILGIRDDKINNMLHVAGEIAPDFRLAQISGAALQMQRELQWFKEVEKIVPAGCKEAKNRDGDTPRQIFTRSHKELLKQGEEWMIGTAGSFILVGTLILTIMYPATVTVPGGNDQNTGFPVFLAKKPFKIFLMSEAVSFYAACISVWKFLGILTSRYAEDDFLVSLPKKLIIGIFALFISTTAMIWSFTVTLLMMHQGQWWAIILILLMASISFTLSAWLELPLLVRMVISTYGPVFNRKIKLEV